MAAKGEVPIDPARSLSLLWGTHGKVGRSGLTVESIVEAAIDIADRDGLDAVSMRRIASPSRRSMMRNLRARWPFGPHIGPVSMS